MKNFIEQFEKINKDFQKVFDKIQELEKKYNNPTKWWLPNYTYDYFIYECGYFTLHGSSGYENEITEIDISQKDVEDLDNFLIQYEEKLIQKELNQKEAEDERKRIKRDSEYKKFLELKAKFDA